MYAMYALREAAARAGVSLYRISLDTGHSRQYVNATITKGSTPQCDTMARMLGVCGYSLVAIPTDKLTDDCIVID